jgi:GxxExxY protein
MDQKEIVERTRRWIETMVIGLNLCPFARRVFETDRIRFVVSSAQDEVKLLADLESELRFLADSPVAAIETTLLIHPNVLCDFLDYNDFLDPAEKLLDDLGLSGVIQIASFHPEYQFADAARDAVENYTNRSPYPMLHLLREASFDAITDDAEELLAIPRRNIETLRTLGREKILAILANLTRSDETKLNTETQRHRENTRAKSLRSVAMEEKDPLTREVIGAAIEVHREMGPGLLESIYQQCMEQELKLRGLTFVPQARVPLVYKNVALNTDLIMDFYFPDQLVVEIKAVEKLVPVHQAQLLTYLRLSKTHVGLLINFNVPVLKEGLKRMVL